MGKILGAIFILLICGTSFFFGVKYSGDAKQKASWLFEADAHQAKLPDLRDTENPPEVAKKQQIDEFVTPTAEDENIMPLIDGKEYVDIEIQLEDSAHSLNEQNQINIESNNHSSTN
jgi:hypothetical protein